MRQIYNFDADQIGLDPKIIHRALGYPNSQDPSRKVAEHLPKITKQVKKWARPVAIAQFETIGRIEKGVVEIKDGPIFHGLKLSMALEREFKVALFALTLGADVCDWLATLNGDDVWSGFLADAIASELVEAAANDLQALLAQSLGPERYYSTLRFSPGYCDWTIEEMPLLLKRINASEIGITLSDGGMMIPQKSICGVVGFSINPDAVDFNPCETCPEEDCNQRRNDDD